eukprot:COSAG02_NODE_1713_length_11220_cov_4.344663_1_plen_677_part_00
MPDPSMDSFVRGDTPLWSEVAVPRPKTFNRDGRLHTPDWHRASFAASELGPQLGAERAMLMTPYSAGLHERFIDADSPAVQADLRRRSGSALGGRSDGHRRHTAGGPLGGGLDSSIPLAPLDSEAAAPDVASLMQQQGTYVANFLRQPTNAPTFLASEMQMAKGSEKRGRKSRSRGQSYRLLAGTLLQASFQDQVSVLDREMQKQSYIRHIPHSLEPQMHQAALTIQSGWRGYLARQYMKMLNKAATKVQALWRGYQGRKRVRIMNAAATRIQAQFRARKYRQWYLTVKAAVLNIQCGWRCCIARRVVADKRATRDGATLLVLELIAEAAALSERNAAKRRALQLARELAIREAKAKKKVAVENLLAASEHGPVACAIKLREEWDGVNGNPIKIEFDVSERSLSYTEQVQEVFDTMDVDGNGTLDRGEISQLGEAMMGGGSKMTEEQLDIAMAVMDADGSGGVDFDEFLKWWMETVKKPAPESPEEVPPPPASGLSLEPLAAADGADGSGGGGGGSGWEGSVFGRFFGGGSGTPSKPPPKPPPPQHSDDVVRRLFDKMDADSSGDLDREEVSTLAKTLGAELEDEASIDAAMAAMDADGNGSVEFDEFRAWYRVFVVEQAEAAADGAESGMRKFFSGLSPKKRRQKQAMVEEADRTAARTVFDSIDADSSGACPCY